MNKVYDIGWKRGTAKVIVSDPSQHLQKNWLRGRFYERQMLRYIAETYGGSNMRIVDAGSSVGNHTLFFAKFVTSGKVLSVEPVHDSLELQKVIIALNDLDKHVVFHECALSDKVGRGSMERFGPPAYNGMQRLVKGDDVEVTTLDKLVGRKKVGLIKIDVEHHEVQVVRGGLKTIKRCRPVLFIECTRPENLSALKEMLIGELNYRVEHKFNASATYEFVFKGQ